MNFAIITAVRIKTAHTGIATLSAPVYENTSVMHCTHIIVFRFPIFFSGCTALCRHPGRKQGKKQYNYKVSLYHNPVIFLISFNLLSASIGVRALMSNPLI